MVKVISLSLLLMLAPALACADDLFGKESVEEALKSHDGDRDGRLTFDELMDGIEKQARRWFDAMDRNNDGVLSDEDAAKTEEDIERSFDWLWDFFRDVMKGDGEKDGLRI